MIRFTNANYFLFALVCLISISGCKKEEPGTSVFHGTEVDFADGKISSYAKISPDGTPLAMGVSFTESMLQNLPQTMSDMSQCYDVDGDGAFGMHECMGMHEIVLDLPDEIKDLTPFKWVLVNWNPFGHSPLGVYNVPHFDAHFYLQSLSERNAINTGPCLNLMDCDDLNTAAAEIPAKYVAADYFFPPDSTTVEPGMGGHLIDLLAPEICCMESFDKTFIYGCYDGRITFYEPMFTLDYLNGKLDEKIAVRVPDAVDVTGFYPREYHIRHDAEQGKYFVALTDFLHRTGE